MSYELEIKKADEIEKKASNQLKNEMKSYFRTYDEWKKIMDEVGFINSTITITKKKG